MKVFALTLGPTLRTVIIVGFGDLRRGKLAVGSCVGELLLLIV